MFIIPAGFLFARMGRAECWSTGRVSNPRIQVLQTCALATSPPVLEKNSCQISVIMAQMFSAPKSHLRLRAATLDQLFPVPCSLKTQNPPRQGRVGCPA
jgi:hypothetical protein